MNKKSKEASEQSNSIIELDKQKIISDKIPKVYIKIQGL